MVYDLNGNLVTRTDGRGFTTAFTYDALNMIVRHTDPAVPTFSEISVTSVVPSSALSPVTEYFYDANRNRVSVKDPRGHYILFAFDTLNRPIQSIIVLESGTSVSLVNSSLNFITYTAYDAAGNIASRTDGNGNVTTFFYDELNRPGKIVSPAVDVTTVDSADNVASFTISPTIYHRYDQHSSDSVLISARGNWGSHLLFAIKYIVIIFPGIKFRPLFCQNLSRLIPSIKSTVFSLHFHILKQWPDPYESSIPERLIIS